MDVQELLTTSIVGGRLEAIVFGFFKCKYKSGVHPGVCLAVMTDPFAPQVGYSALKPMIKY